MSAIRVAALTLLLTSGSAVAQDQSEAIAAASAAWDEAYNARDLDALMERYHEDAVSMAPGYPASEGRDAIRADFEALFAETTSATHASEILEVVIVEDHAIERANYTGQFTPSGGEPIDEEGKHIVIYRQDENGDWKVLWEIWNENE